MPRGLFDNIGSKTTTSTQLAKEISKLAKLGNVQNGLPGAMRAFPVAAIVAGNVYARVLAKDGENVVEKAILKGVWKDDDEGVLGLQAPGEARRDGQRESEEGGKARDENTSDGLTESGEGGKAGEDNKSAR